MEEKTEYAKSKLSKGIQVKTTCIFCKRRTAQRVVKKGIAHLCVPCENVVEAENLWKKLGLTPFRKASTGLMPMDTLRFVSEFKRLWALGLRPRDIATMWQCGVSVVWDRMMRMRKLGHDIPSSRPLTVKADTSAPKMETGRGRKLNGHGEGARGVRNCTSGKDGKKCEPCLEAQRRWKKSNTERKKLLRQALEQETQQ